MSSSQKRVKLRAVTYRKYKTVVVLFAVVFAVFSRTARAEGIHWFDDYAAAKAEAGKTGKPIFLAFRCSP